MIVLYNSDFFGREPGSRNFFALFSSHIFHFCVKISRFLENLANYLEFPGIPANFVKFAAKNSRFDAKNCIILQKCGKFKDISRNDAKSAESSNFQLDNCVDLEKR